MNSIEQQVKDLQRENEKLRKDLDKVMQYTTTLGGSLEFRELVKLYGKENSEFTILKILNSFGLVVAPIGQRNHVDNPVGGVTTDAEARTAINSILSTLEAFGFHKTS